MSELMMSPVVSAGDSEALLCESNGEERGYTRLFFQEQRFGLASLLSPVRLLLCALTLAAGFVRASDAANASSCENNTDILECQRFVQGQSARLLLTALAFALLLLATIPTHLILRRLNWRVMRTGFLSTARLLD